MVKFQQIMERLERDNRSKFKKKKKKNNLGGSDCLKVTTNFIKVGLLVK